MSDKNNPTAPAQSAAVERANLSGKRSCIFSDSPGQPLEYEYGNEQ